MVCRRSSGGVITLDQDHAYVLVYIISLYLSCVCDNVLSGLSGERGSSWLNSYIHDQVKNKQIN